MLEFIWIYSFFLVGIEFSVALDIPSTGFGFSSTCIPNSDGVISLELVNFRSLPVNITIECLHRMYTLTLAPSETRSFPMSVTPKTAKDECIMNPWTPSGRFNVYIVAAESREIVVDHVLFCDMGVTPSRPIQHFTTSCQRENQEVEIELHNTESVPLTYYIECWRSFYQIQLKPGEKMNFPAVLYRGNLDYGTAIYNGGVKDMCVFCPWTSDGIQYIHITTEDVELVTYSRVVYCATNPSKDKPIVEFTSECSMDHTGLISIDIENLKNESVHLEIFCSDDWYRLDLSPFETYAFSAVFQRDYSFDYLPGACVLQVWPEHMDSDQCLFAVMEEADRDFTCTTFSCKFSPHKPFRISSTCQLNPFGLVPLRLENNQATPVSFVAQCHRNLHFTTVPPESVVNVPLVFYQGQEVINDESACVFQPKSEGIQGLFTENAHSAQEVTHNYLYCDLRQDPAKEMVPFETTCNPENASAVIQLRNDGPEMVTFVMYCDENTYHIPLQPNTTVDFPAALYTGEISYGTAVYNGDEQPKCVFKPWTTAGTQVLFMGLKGSFEEIPFTTYCTLGPEVNPHSITYESTCQPRAGGIFDLVLTNHEKDVVAVELVCSNRFFTFRLKAGDRVVQPAAFYQGDEHFYPKDACIFIDYTIMFGEYQHVLLFSENSVQKFRKERFFCEKRNPRTLHNGHVSTTCRPDHLGRVPIELTNDGDEPVVFTLRCENGNMQHTIDPGTSVTTSGVFSKWADTAPNDACIFRERSASIQSIIAGVMLSDQDYTIESLQCDVSKSPPKRFISVNTDCRPNESGEIQVNIKNEGHENLTFGISCWSTEMELTVEPNEVATFSAVFFDGTTNGDPNACEFMPWSHLGWQTIFISGQSNDYSVFQYLFCQTSVQTDAPNVSFESTCTTDESGLTAVNIHNHDDEAVFVTIGCNQAWHNVTLKPTSSVAFPVAFNEDEGQTESPDTCVMMDRSDFFLPLQFVWLLAEKPDGQYTERNVFCERRPPAPNSPIVSLIPHCGLTMESPSVIELRTDVPAYGVAKCRNGDKPFTTQDDVSYTIAAVFNQSYVGQDCLFYKKINSDTFTVEVEIGWGERDTQVIPNKQIRTVSCSYNDHGMDKSSSQPIAEWFLSPMEKQSLFGRNASDVFRLSVIDVLGTEVDSDQLSIGRRIRLKAEVVSGQITAFRALSCEAYNEINTYAILRAGCGDGLIFNKAEGFQTVGSTVFSPYFQTFKLAGGSSLNFRCRFTACETGSCDGDSCQTESRTRRSAPSELVDSKTNTKSFRPTGV